MIKFVVTDCDGTLLDPTQQIQAADRDALVELAKNNIALATASGRNERETEEVVVQLPESVRRSLHRIVQNGAAVYAHPMVNIYKRYFQPSLAQRMDEVGKGKQVPIFFSTSDQIYIPRKAAIFAEIEKTTSAPICYDPTVIDRIGIDLFPSKICFIEEQSKLQQLLPHLHDHFAGEIEAAITGPIHLDVMPAGVNKGVGVRKLAEYLGFSVKEVAVIGDAGNDIPMFDIADHSFVMNHAKPDVKQRAKQEVRTVAEAVQHILDYNSNIN
jgi:Cof subfamily protein (haloacid dehalogenase superfamily)